jgi:hypothetical protein
MRAGMLRRAVVRRVSGWGVAGEEKASGEEKTGKGHRNGTRGARYRFL